MASGGLIKAEKPSRADASEVGMHSGRHPPLVFSPEGRSFPVGTCSTTSFRDRKDDAELRWTQSMEIGKLMINRFSSKLFVLPQSRRRVEFRHLTLSDLKEPL